MERSIEGFEFRLNIGYLQISGGFSAKFQSVEGESDWARIIMSEELEEILKDRNFDCSSLELGGDGDYEELIGGYGIRPETKSNVLIIRNEMERLHQTYISATFLNATPQEAARYIFAVAGIQNFNLTDENFASKPVYTINYMRATDALNELNNVYGINLKLIYRDNIFWWGTAPEQEDCYVLTDDNILDIRRSGDIWQAEVLAVPWIHTGDFIAVECDEYVGMGKVAKCMISSADAGIDMYIEFEEADVG